jgi:hypothetical protein
MMDPEMLFNYSCRSLLLVNSYFLRQLPVGCVARIDPSKFLDAFSMEIDGQRVNARDWLYGPTGYTRTVPEDQTDPLMMDADKRFVDAVKHGVQEFLEQEEQGAKFIPNLLGRDVRAFQRVVGKYGKRGSKKQSQSFNVSYLMTSSSNHLLLASKRKAGSQATQQSKRTYI